MHHIIDGYNVLKQVRYNTGERITHGRKGFIKFLERKFNNKNITVVFDGTPGLDDNFYKSSIKIRFSRQRSADDLIRQIVKETQDKKTIVITDDRDLKDSLRKFNVDVKKVDEFLKECYNNESDKLKTSPKKPDILSTKGKKITDYLYKKLTEDI